MRMDVNQIVDATKVIGHELKAYHKGQDAFYMRGTVKFTGQTVNKNWTYLQKHLTCENYIITTKQLVNVR